ncbi:MAG TPA: hypothetical protein VD997_00435 [Phycisphaerales bacterium]|nr:hypothetical protein [Phycisphaerales bacterium]
MLSRLLRSRSGNPAPFENLEQRTLMAADLTVSVGGLQTVNANGATNLRMPVTVSNVGNTPLVGGGRVEFYLSSNRTLDENDFLFESRPLPRLGRPGSASRFTLDAPLPANLAPAVGRPLAAGNYFVIARVVPTRANADTRTANNVAASTTTANVSYDFGTVNGRSDVFLNLTLPDGDIVRIGLNGPGTGRVVNVGNRLVVVVNGTNHQSILSMTPVRGDPTLNGLDINGTIKDIIADRVHIDGDIDIAGSVGSVTLGNVSNSNFVVRGFGNWGATLGNVTNTTITSNLSPLRGLHVNQWVDSDGVRDVIAVPYIGTLASNGDFAASPRILSNNKGFAIEKVDIQGTLRAGAWQINSSVETINVGAIAADWGGSIRGEVNQFNVGRNLSGTLAIGSVRRLIIGGNVTNANILVGANLGADGRLGGTGANQDTFQAGAVGILEIRGGVSNSVIAAGLQTTDATLLDEDDRVIQGGFFSAINVRRQVTNSKFVGETIPQRARINGRVVNTANNAIFVRTLGAP